jgi:hypothetical protein
MQRSIRDLNILDNRCDHFLLKEHNVRDHIDPRQGQPEHGANIGTKLKVFHIIACCCLLLRPVAIEVDGLQLGEVRLLMAI